MTERLRTRLNAPRDASSLAALRILFGLLMAASVARYFASDWVDRFYVQRTFYFSYWGFGWVRPLPEPGMTLLFVVIGLAAIFVALGLYYRVAAITFLLSFTYVHLLDVSNYLNHYYLVSLLALLMCVLPMHRTFSIDALRDPSIRGATLPAWMIYLVRFQVGVVYVFAGLAKLGPDWLLHGQPLDIWLHARTDTPVLGPLFEEPYVAILMSWGGFLFDTTIIVWLSWKRTRPYAYLAVCVFHLVTNLLFQIGIFPILMTIAALTFFEPEWPRVFMAKLRRVEWKPASEPAPQRWALGSLGMAVLGAWGLLHVLVPLRTHAYGSDVLWHEQGMRWSWRVMVREKNGDVEYRVRVNGEERERRFIPSDFGLTREQEMEFAGQPDLILQLAHHIADDLAARGYDDVEVRADAWVSLNGRPSARLIDPDVDLAAIDDGVGMASWILPAPSGPPIQLRSRRDARLASR